MYLSIFGFILLSIPFLALQKFRCKKEGFFNIILLILFIQLVIAVLTQSLHIFTYQTIIILNIIICLIFIFVFRPYKIDLKFVKKIDVSLIFVIFIAFLALSSVHYNYKGVYSTITNPINEPVTSFNYPYPYFSDEWYAIAFIKDAIKTKSLPVRNPISYGPFTNLEMATHSLLAEVVLLLNLNPVTNYVNISIGVNTLIIVLIYLLLAVNKIQKPLAAIAALSALYIANAGLLPGLWALLPLNLGIVFMLLSLALYKLKSRNMFELSFFLTLIFYPPLIIFILILLIFQLLTKSPREGIKLFYFYATLIGISAVLISTLFLFDLIKFGHIFNLIFHKLFYYSLLGSNTISSYPIYYVVPIQILIFALIGVYPAWTERKELIVISTVSLLFWFYYTFTPARFIIEYERLVIVSSIFIVILAGFGLKYFFSLLEKMTHKKSSYLHYIILAAFLPLLLFYTKSNAWKNFTVHQIGSDLVSTSKPLANRYLHPDDLKLFSGIKNKRFLSTAWKGTVISIATDNRPHAIKDGTISQPNQNFFVEFLNMSCKKKNDFTKKFNINYIYTPKFNCPEFQLEGTSAEGLVLYKVLLK